MNSVLAELLGVGWGFGVESSVRLMTGSLASSLSVFTKLQNSEKEGYLFLSVLIFMLCLRHLWLIQSGSFVAILEIVLISLSVERSNTVSDAA